MSVIIRNMNGGHSNRNWALAKQWTTMQNNFFKAAMKRTYCKSLLVSNLALFNLRDIIISKCSFQESSFQIQNPCITDLEKENIYITQNQAFA